MNVLRNDVWRWRCFKQSRTMFALHLDRGFPVDQFGLPGAARHTIVGEQTLI